MVIATCVFKLQLYGVYSLKEKRQIVKSLLSRLPQEFNLAVAEVDHQDIWQTAGIALVTIGTDANHLHGLLEKCVGWIEHNRPDLFIEQYAIRLV